MRWYCPKCATWHCHLSAGEWQLSPGSWFVTCNDCETMWRMDLEMHEVEPSGNPGDLGGEG